MVNAARGRKLYGWATSVLGLLVFGVTVANLSFSNLATFGLYLLFASGAALLPINPIVKGLPTGFPMVLLAFAELSESQVLVVSLGATLMHEIHLGWRGRQKDIVHRACRIVICTLVTHKTYVLVATAFGTNPILPLGLVMSSVAVYGYCMVECAVGKPKSVTFWQAHSQEASWLFSWLIANCYLVNIIEYASQQTGLFAGILALPVIIATHFVYRRFAMARERWQKQTDELTAVTMRTIEALALAVEAKDADANMHLRRVQTYAVAIGQEMGLSELELQGLYAAAYLHDVGKLAVPEYIVSKPGKLTAEEFEKVKIHPIVGGEILDRLELPYPVAPIVRAHHEKWDGSGYPYGLMADAIPLGARILAAVDCLDALCSNRPYRVALSLEEAMDKVEAEAGKSFDPEVVKILRRRCKELEWTAQSNATQEPLVPAGWQIRRGIAPEAELAGESTSIESVLGPIASARQEHSAIHEFLNHLTTSHTIDEVFASVTANIAKVVSYDAVAVYMRKDQSLSSEFIGGEFSHLLQPGEFPEGQGLSGWVAKHHKAIVNGNPAVEACYPRDPNSAVKLECALAVPLKARRGLIGVLALYGTRRDAFNREDLRILQTLSSTIASSLEKAMQYHTAESTAHTDHLTGIPNARSLAQHLEREVARASRARSPLAVLVCDLDGFKGVNDTLGHLAGNEVLIAVAKALQSAGRTADHVARMGGDEFVIVMPDQTHSGIDSHIDRLREQVEKAGIQVCGERSVSMSAGIAWLGEDGDDAVDLLAAADRRMYSIKSKRKGNRSASAAEFIDTQDAKTNHSESLLSLIRRISHRGEPARDVQAESAVMTLVPSLPEGSD